MARVVVVGAGVVGLSCAVRLLEAGHRVDVVARDLPLETTSAVAAALWYPYRAFPHERVPAGRGRPTARSPTCPVTSAPASGCCPAPSCYTPRQADPWWRDAVPELTRVTGLQPPYADGWTSWRPIVEMPVYLTWLAARVEALGGTLTRMALTALPDHAEVVVNAPASAPGGWPTTRPAPVRGQVVYVDQVGLDRWWLSRAPRPDRLRRAPLAGHRGRRHGRRGGVGPAPRPRRRQAHPGAGRRAGARAAAGPGAAATGSGCGRRARPYAWRSRSPSGAGSCTATATAAPA